jgi:hypothetical protein
MKKFGLILFFILFISFTSAQVLKRDANGNITGGEYRRSGDKINIVTLKIY